MIADLPLLNVEPVPCRELAGEALALATATDRSAYDSMYLALAVRLETQLVTADARFANAIKAIPSLGSHIRFIAEI